MERRAVFPERDIPRAFLIRGTLWHRETGTDAMRVENEPKRRYGKLSQAAL